MDTERLHLDMGSHQTATICKLFGPLAMADLRISVDTKRAEWVIERKCHRDKDGLDVYWEVTARICGQGEDF